MSIVKKVSGVALAVLLINVSLEGQEVKGPTIKGHASKGQAMTGQAISIIPEPVEVTTAEGLFLMNQQPGLSINPNADSCRQTINIFLEYLSDYYHPGLKTTLNSSSAKTNGIVFSINKKLFDPYRAEAYDIEVKATGITVQATDAAGMFYALESLKQVLEKTGIRAMHIRDFPQYAYRGMHLDVSRHFFPADFIKKYIDLLAAYKINTFHWHLTDSHGWRLEIKKYPRLTSVGAWRAPRDNVPMTIALPTQPGEPATYGGFYTQAQVREIIAYAKSKFITIIPEIEMPGHCTAALVAYPEYSTQNSTVPLLMPTGYAGDLLHNFCVGNDSTFHFLNDILDEVMDLFPGEYIHIGGDEVRGDPWLRCPRCSSLMRRKGYTTAKQLQAYFTERIDSFVNSRGRKSIGWDEILEAGNLSENAAVISWRGVQGGIEGAKKGHKVVMAPFRYAYFDFYQSDPALEPDITYAGLYLDSVYAFDPTPPVLSESQAANILGAQACLWTENIATTDRVEYMLLPRMIAFAEAIWTAPQRKNYRHFITKLESHLAGLRKQHVNFSTSLYNTGFIPVYDSVSGFINLGITNQVAGLYAVRYADNNQLPGASSPQYTRPLVIRGTQKITAGLFDDHGRLLGKLNSQQFSFHKAIGKPVTFKVTKTIEQPQRVTRALADGIFGTIEPYDGRWQFFTDSVVTIDIDLKKTVSIDSVRFRCLEETVGSAFVPGRYTLSTSADGGIYKQIQAKETGKVPAEDLRHITCFAIDTRGESTRFIRLTLERSNSLPRSAIQPLLFIDEIEVF
jgi:hexosaminidase